MSLFVLSCKDGWVNIMYDGLDAVGVDQQVMTQGLFQWLNSFSLTGLQSSLCRRPLYSDFEQHIIFHVKLLLSEKQHTVCAVGILKNGTPVEPHRRS